MGNEEKFLSSNPNIMDKDNPYLFDKDNLNNFGLPPLPGILKAKILETEENEKSDENNNDNDNKDESNDDKNNIEITPPQLPSLGPLMKNILEAKETEIESFNENLKKIIIIIQMIAKIMKIITF